MASLLSSRWVNLEQLKPLSLLAAFLQRLTEHDAMEIALADESIPSVCRSEDNAAFKSQA
jgi:hypothetical protein